MSTPLDIFVSWILVELQVPCYFLESRAENLMEEIRSSQKAHLQLSLVSPFLTMFALFETKYNIPPHHLVSFQKNINSKNQSHDKRHFVTKIKEVNRWVYNPLSHLTSIYLSTVVLVFHMLQGL